MRLKLALEGDKIAFWQFHFRGNLFLQFYDEVRYIPNRRLDGNGKTTLAILAEDYVRPLRLADVGDEGKRDVLILRHLDRELGDFIRGIPPFQRQACDQIDGLLAIAQLGDFLAADKGGEFLVELAGGDAVGGGAVAVRLDAELGNGRLHIKLGILEAGNGLRDGLDFDADFPQLRKIRPENFHRHRSRDSAEHVADSIC